MPLNLPTMAQVQAKRRAEPKKAAAAKPAPARAPRPIRERPRTRAKRKGTAWVRPYVFRRERDLCRYCGDLKKRKAESRHELLPKGAGGEVSPENSVACCGDGTRGCHGFAQRNEIAWREDVRLTPDEPKGAEGGLLFTVASKAAAKWLGVKLGETFQSRPRYAAYRPL